MKKIMIAVIVFAMAGMLCAGENITVVTENWKPYNYEEDGIFKGTSTEIVRAVLDRAGVNYTIELYPWARAYLMAQREKNILIYTIVRTPIRENLFKWIRPVAEPDRVSFYKLTKRKDIDIRSFEDVKKFRTGVLREDVKHQYLISLGFEEGKHIKPVVRQRQNFKKLLANRIDLVVLSEKNFSSEMESFRVLKDELEEVLLLFEAIPYMAFSKNTSDEMVEMIVKSYDQLVYEGKVKKLD
jgi:polar amino acid transport system substrate-binding protein